MFKDVNVPENSLVVREAIGNSNADTLMCVTDYTSCCTGDTENGWYWDNQENVQIPTSGNNIFMSQGDRVVRLHQMNNPTSEGIFWCRIRVAADTFQELYVGVYGSTDPDGGDG